MPKKIEEKKEEIIEEVPKKVEPSVKIPRFKTWAEREKFFMKHPDLSPKE